MQSLVHSLKRCLYILLGIIKDHSLISHYFNLAGNTKKKTNNHSTVWSVQTYTLENGSLLRCIYVIIKTHISIIIT